jgi:hypothetical protein
MRILSLSWAFHRARLAHLTTIAHEQQPETFFPKFVVMVAGCEAPAKRVDLGILPTSDPATLQLLQTLATRLGTG